MPKTLKESPPLKFLFFPKYYRMKPITILLPFLICSSVYAQKFVETISLDFKSYQDNYTDEHFSADQLPEISASRFETDCQDLEQKKIHFFSLGINWIYPNYAKDKSTEFVKNKSQPVAIIVDRNSRLAQIAIDRNSNASFCDETLDTISFGVESKIIEIEFFTDKSVLRFPVLFKIDLFGAFPEVTISRPYIYSVHIPQISTNDISIFTSLESMYFFLEEVKNDQAKTLCLIDEPFEHDGVFYEITNVNLINQSADLYEFERNEKPIGVRKGLFLERTEVVQSIYSIPGFKEEINTSSTIVLHFWTDWCAPCIKQMPKIKILEKRVSKMSNAILVNAIVALREDEHTRILNFLENHRIAENNFIIPLRSKGEKNQ